MQNLGYDSIFSDSETRVEAAIMSSMTVDANETHDFFSGPVRLMSWQKLKKPPTTIGIRMQFTASIDGDNLILSWDNKSPHVERDLHELEGAWEDFNSYRFRFDEPTAKKVLKYAKMNGKLIFASGAKEAVKELVEATKRAERLTRGDADAEVPQNLIDQAPETQRRYALTSALELPLLAATNQRFSQMIPVRQDAADDCVNDCR
jgi:hypothetical protein